VESLSGELIHSLRAENKTLFLFLPQHARVSSHFPYRKRCCIDSFAGNNGNGSPRFSSSFCLSRRKIGNGKGGGGGCQEGLLASPAPLDIPSFLGRQMQKDVKTLEDEKGKRTQGSVDEG